MHYTHHVILQFLHVSGELLCPTQQLLCLTPHWLNWWLCEEGREKKTVEVDWNDKDWNTDEEEELEEE